MEWNVRECNEWCVIMWANFVKLIHLIEWNLSKWEVEVFINNNDNNSNFMLIYHISLSNFVK